MLVLAMLTALGKPNELKAHTRGALRNGVTVEEIRELLIHATVYCGIPAGVDAFRNAKQAIDAWEADQKSIGVSVVSRPVLVHAAFRDLSPTHQ